LLSGVVQLGTVTLSVGRDIFQTASVTPEQWLLILGLSLLPVTVLETFKFLPVRRRPASLHDAELKSARP
jgi:hypothetical protein